MNNDDLVNQLIAQGVLKTPALSEAFRSIDRADFVPPSARHQAYLDRPLPIGYGQTISQPYTVALMLELLDPKPGHYILDIGTGSGWQTALLAAAVKPHGHVFSMERIPELVTQSIKNISRYNFIKQGLVSIFSANARLGAPDYAPFDKIIAAAEVKDIPSPWLDQLKNKGRLVVPQNNNLIVVDKKSATKYTQKIIPGFVFVPFIND